MSECVLVYKDLEQHITSRGKHKCKALEVEKILSCSKDRRKARMSGTLWTHGESVRLVRVRCMSGPFM